MSTQLKKVPSFFTWNFYPFCYPLSVVLDLISFFKKLKVITPQVCIEKIIKHMLQYRTRHQSIPVGTSSHSNFKVTPRTKNYSIYLVFTILFQRDDPSHIIALYYPKSTQFLDISNPIHRTILQPVTTRSLLPDRNPLRKVSFLE